MNYKTTLPIYKIMETEQVSDKFRKREFVLLDDENPTYPQYVVFQTVQDKTELLDGLKERDLVEVDFNVRGREWTSPQGVTKYFNSLEAWRILKVHGATKPPVTSPHVEEATIIESEPDLPF